MALKLLQPGLRPMGQFDIDNDVTKANITGGELMSLQTPAGSVAETAAADVSTPGPAAEAAFAADCTLQSKLETSGTDLIIGFLSDEGVAGYGTLFGSLIGAGTGLATQSGAAGGAVVIGPRTSSGSDKVTLHHAPGLYGFDGPVDGTTTAVGAASDCWSGTIDATVGTHYSTDGNGKWATSSTNDQAHCIMLGSMTDESLVSTTAAAATGSAVVGSYAMYFLGATGTVKVS